MSGKGPEKIIVIEETDPKKSPSRLLAPPNKDGQQIIVAPVQTGEQKKQALQEDLDVAFNAGGPA